MGPRRSDAPLQIAVNARFLTQPMTGVQRYGRELMGAIDRLLDEESWGRRFVVRAFSPALDSAVASWRNVPLIRKGDFSGPFWEQSVLPIAARGDWLFCPANTAPFAALYGQRPVAVTLHSLSFQHVPRSYTAVFRLFYGVLIPQIVRRSRLIFTVSEAERATIQSIYPTAASRLRVTPPGGLSGDAAGPASVAGPDAPFLFVGSMSAAKNLRLVIEALDILHARGLNPTLQVAGSAGATFADSGLTIPRYLAGQVTLLGQVNNSSRMTALYAKSLALVLPSLYESAGLPATEAGACGCPLILSDLPALRERCGDAAIYIDPRDARSLADAMAMLMRDPALHAELSSAGRKQSERWTWRNCAEATLAAFEAAGACE